MTDNSNWPMFPYPEPREAQREGMPKLYDTIQNNGVYLLEGECGTGKTAYALTPSIKAVNERGNQYERVVVTVPNKQNLGPFQDFVESYNKRNEDHITALTVVGKTDLHPYIRHGVIGYGNGISKTQHLAENTRELINKSEDSYRMAMKLVDNAKTNVDTLKNYPYQKEIPEINDYEYDPFYAKYIAAQIDGDGEDANIPFNYRSHGLISVETLMENVAEEGYSPHKVMRDLLTEVDVVLANYAHIFNEMTVERMTEDLLDDSSILICDEGHNMIQRVRSSTSNEVSIERMETGASVIDEVLEWDDNEPVTEPTGSTNRESATLATDMIESSPYTREDIEKLQEVTESIQNRLSKIIDAEKSAGDGWHENGEMIEIPLRNPESISKDMVLEFNGHSIMENAYGIGQLIETIRTEVYEEIYEQNYTSYMGSIGYTLEQWYTRDVVEYFPEIQLTEKHNTGRTTGKGHWSEKYNAKLALRTTVPRKKISETIDEFGASVVMSATLSPKDEFMAVTGIETLDRDVEWEYHELPFPEENRLTVGVDAPAFKYSNRKSVDSGTRTRTQYKNLIVETIKESEGKTLIAMPSYKEAEWMGRKIENNTTLRKDKDLIIDESSTNSVTNAMKKKFFEAEDNAVLCTSCQGTLVEGVDYEGDKLHNVIVVGVPISNTQSPYQQAILHSYQSRKMFGDKGREYYYNVPPSRKSRQALGRVIRSHDDVGTRILIDRRYVEEDEWDSVYDHFPADFQDSIKKVDTVDLPEEVAQWWNRQN